MSWRLNLAILECSLQSLSKVQNGGEAFFRLFGECLQDHSIHFDRQQRLRLAGRWWRNVEMLVHHLLLPTLEWQDTRQQLIGHDRQGVLIGRRYSVTAPLLRCHI